jgi:gliding motility-associated-like protein
VWAYVVRPIALANWDTSIVIGDNAILPVKKSIFHKFNWRPTSGLSCIDCDYPSVQPLSDITYRLKVTDALNCFNDDFEYKIVVRPETFIKMPTAFSPNGDGANDLLEVKGWGIKELLYFQIFNRWGELVYESTDLEKGWDGTFKGKPQNSDVYIYKVKVKTWREKEDYTEGYVNLFLLGRCWELGFGR